MGCARFGHFANLFILMDLLILGGLLRPGAIGSMEYLQICKCVSSFAYERVLDWMFYK